MATAMRLYVFAKGNELNIDSEYSAITVTASIKAFVTHLQNELGCSVNLSQKALKGCMDIQKYLSAYELIGKTNIRALKKHFSAGKYPYRIAFDNLFVDGDKIKYFTLNSGNLGMPNFWGRYCMVFNLDYFDFNFSAITRQNTLTPNRTGGGYYYFKAKVPDVNKIRDEISILSQAVKHCVIKKQKSILGTKTEQYPELVCYSGVRPGNSRSADYLELITTQDCLLTKPCKIRLTEQEMLYFFNATFDSFNGNTLKQNKRAIDREADEFVALYDKYQFEIDLIKV